MAISNDDKFCTEHDTAKYMWYTWQTDTWQCDKCWDDAMEDVFDMPRQYGTERDSNE